MSFPAAVSLGLFLALPSSASPSGTQPSFDLTDAGRPMPAGTAVALIVATPGFAAPAYDTLVHALEAEGVDAWLLRLPLHAQGVDAAVTQALPLARRSLPTAPLALVGHGLGGTLAARAALVEPPDALALLGAPLAPPSSALVTWLASLPVPDDGLDLATVGTASWRGQPALPLLVGATLPPLQRVSATWLRDLQGWVARGDPIDLSAAAFPVWAGVGLLDEVAPAEVVRPHLGAHEFVRFGYLRLDLQSFDHAGLLAEQRPVNALARWVEQSLRR